MSTVDWKEWEKEHRSAGGNKPFVVDGIIDQKEWDDAPIKILFILKEAHGGEEDWNLCDCIKNKWQGPKKGSKTWQSIAQWAYGIQELKKTGSIPIFPNKDNDGLNKALLSSAVINIKKSNGEKVSDNQDLIKYLKQDWHRLLEQINSINPDIIVCGSTWWHVIKAYLDDNKSLKEYSKLGEWTYKWGNHHFIDFWHPANRYPYKLNYYSLCTVISIMRPEINF